MNKQTTAPDWSFWGNLPDVMIWQAVALSLNTDPASLDMPGGFDPDRCKNLPDGFKPRLSVACGNQMQLGVCRSMTEKYHAPCQLTVNLRRFGLWAASLPYPWELPNGFPMLKEEGVADNADMAPPRNAMAPTSQRPPAHGLTKAEMLANDWPVNSALNLPRLLSDVPKWLEPARLTKGARGKNSSALWSPSMFAVCLLSEKAISKSALTRYMTRYMPEWADDWETLSEDL